MSDDSYDTLRRAMISALGPRPSPERRRQIAADLRALAEQQERLAATGTPARQPSTTADTPAASQPRRQPGMYIRLGHEPDRQTGGLQLRLSLGIQIWNDLGSPERIDVQRVGSELWVVPAKGKAGYLLSSGAGLPSCIVDRAGPLAGLPPGRYAASLRAGAAVVGERVG